MMFLISGLLMPRPKAIVATICVGLVGTSPSYNMIPYGRWDTYCDVIALHEAVLSGIAGGLVHTGVVGEGLDTGILEKSCHDFSCLVSIVSC